MANRNPSPSPASASNPNHDGDYDRMAVDLGALEQQLRRDNPPLAPKLRQSMAKPRAGAEKTIRTVVQLARQYNVQVGAVSPDDIEVANEHASAAAVLLPVCYALTQAAEDRVLRSSSACWSGATLYYTVLKRLARTNPKLAAQMKPLKRFFAQRSSEVQASQALARAERKAARAGNQAARAAKAAGAIKARQGETTPNTEVVLNLPPSGPGVASGATGGNAANGANGGNAANGVNGHP